MNIALWIITGLLTALYLFSGFGKLFVPREKMAQMGQRRALGPRLQARHP
ncbi:hypothetical protein GCM10020220_006650 [Nonomuraea rubra]